MEIDRDQGEQAIGRRDEEPATPKRNGANGQNQPATNGSVPPKSTPTQEPPRQQQPEAATNKQVQYLLSIGKRQRLSTTQLETRIAEILGRRVGVYQLSKREAGTVIEALTEAVAGNGKTDKR